MGVIRKNIAYQALAQGVGKGLMFLAFILLARILGPQAYGTFDYSFAVVQLVGGIFFELGLVLIVTKELATGSNYEVFPVALLLKVQGCIIGSVIILIIAPFLELPAVLAFFLVFYCIQNSYTNLYTTVFRAANRMFGETLTVIFQRSLIVAALVFVLSSGERFPDLPDLCSGIFAAAASCGLVLIVILKKRMFPEIPRIRDLSGRVARTVALGREALPLIGVSIFWLVYYRIDMVLLGRISTHVEVGFYSSAYRIMEASLLIPLVITNAVFPRLTNLWVSDREGFVSFLKKIMVWVFASAGFVCTVLFLSAAPVLRVLFGADFLPAAGVLRILALALVAVYPGFVVTQVLVIQRRQVCYMWLSIMAAALNIILNLVLIPVWGAKGAAFSTLVTETAVTCIASGIVVSQVKTGSVR